MPEGDVELANTVTVLLIGAELVRRWDQLDPGSRRTVAEIMAERVEKLGTVLFPNPPVDLTNIDSPIDDASPDVIYRST